MTMWRTASGEERTVYNALPTLPTYNFAELHERASHARASYCTVLAGGVHSVRDAAARTPAYDAASSLSTNSNNNNNSDTAGCGIPVHVLLQHFPTWRTLDDKVLRFFAYYVEPVSESTREAWRVRKVKVHYYLADGTVSITETPAEANSGLRRGLTVARHRPEEAQRVDVYTLCVGGTLRCRGVDYTLVDCDAATRTFYDVLGMPQPADALPYPCDAFAAAAAAATTTTTRPTRDEEQATMRRVIEATAAVRAGTHTSLLTPSERAAARAFFAHDGEVLRFYATWQRRRFRVCYYVADDTLSVLFDGTTTTTSQQQHHDDGYDRNAVFLRRGKVPRTPPSTTCKSNSNNNNTIGDDRDAQPQLETLRPPCGVTPAYVTRDDLYVGASVTLYGRTFYLYDCDAYTRAQLQQRRLPAAALPCPVPADATDRHGSARRRRHDDAGASQQQQQQQQQQHSLPPYADEVFRFTARLAHARDGDGDRLFVLCYHVGDATASLHEAPQHKGGGAACAGGVVCARRALHASSITPPPLQQQQPSSSAMTVPRDAGGRGVVSLLVPGAVVTLDGVAYVLVDMDAHTRACRARGVPEAASDADARATALLARIRDALRRGYARSTEAFRRVATLRLVADHDDDDHSHDNSGDAATMVVAVGLSRRDVRALLASAAARGGAAVVDEDVLTCVMQRIAQPWPPYTRALQPPLHKHEHDDNNSEHDDDECRLYVPFDAFAEQLMGEPFASRVPQRTAEASASASMATAAGSSGGGGGGGRVPRGAIRTAEARAQSVAEAAAAEAALRTLLLRSEVRRTLLLHSLRATAADTYDGNVGVDDFCACLTQRVRVSLRDDELQALVRRFYYTPGVDNWQARRLPLAELRRLIML